MALTEPIPRNTLKERPSRGSTPRDSRPVPAKRFPIITDCGAGGQRLDDVAGVLDPPSAITGTSCFAASSTQSMIAVIWGTPIPATTRVVQEAPGPIPTLTASTPAAMRSRAPAAVATLPPIS